MEFVIEVVSNVHCAYIIEIVGKCFPLSCFDRKIREGREFHLCANTKWYHEGKSTVLNTFRLQGILLSIQCRLRIKI